MKKKYAEKVRANFYSASKSVPPSAYLGWLKKIRIRVRPGDIGEVTHPDSIQPSFRDNAIFHLNHFGSIQATKNDDGLFCGWYGEGIIVDSSRIKGLVRLAQQYELWRGFIKFVVYLFGKT